MEVFPASAPALLRYLQAEGFELRADGDRLQIRPVDRVSEELRAEIGKRKAELLLLLQAAIDLVSLRGSLTVPRAPLELCLELEARGFRQTVSANGEYEIEPSRGLTDADRAAIARWRRHLAAVVSYDAPTCA
jgi:hypothetical protein